VLNAIWTRTAGAKVGAGPTSPFTAFHHRDVTDSDVHVAP